MTTDEHFACWTSWWKWLLLAPLYGGEIFARKDLLRVYTYEEEGISDYSLHQWHTHHEKIADIWNGRLSPSRLRLRAEPKDV